MSSTIDKIYIYSIFGFFGFIRTLIQASKKIVFSVESSSIRVEFLNETFMAELKPLVTEKYQFQCRDESELIAIFGLSRI